jgi:hypothetical protein
MYGIGIWGGLRPQTPVAVVWAEWWKYKGEKWKYGSYRLTFYFVKSKSLALVLTCPMHMVMIPLTVRT